jgi:dynein heavy chain
LDHNGWYNRKDQQLIKIENILLLTALGPPGGGRTHITPRIIRHFNVIAYTEMSDETISYIFNSIVSFFLRNFNEEVREILPVIVSTVIEIYE